MFLSSQLRDLCASVVNLFSDFDLPVSNGLISTGR